MGNKVYSIIQERVIKEITEQVEAMVKDPSLSFRWVRPWGGC